MSIFTEIKVRLARLTRTQRIAIVVVVVLLIAFAILSFILRTPEQIAISTIRWKTNPISSEKTKTETFVSENYDVFYSSVDDRFYVSVKSGAEYDFEMVKDRIFYDLKRVGYTSTELSRVEFLDYRGTSTELDPLEPSAPEKQ